MSKPAIFGIYGDSDSGKTKLMVYLISHLTKEGYSVVAVKQTQKKISLDMINKDTGRYHQGGADLVVFSSDCETDFFLYKKSNFPEIIKRIHGFGCYDIILVEGACDQSIQKIKLGNGKTRSNTIVSYKGNVKEILTLINKELKKKSVIQKFSISVNGHNVPLSKFPEQIIKSTIVGMLGSLKDVHDIDEVTIKLERSK